MIQCSIYYSTFNKSQFFIASEYFDEEKSIPKNICFFLRSDESKNAKILSNENKFPFICAYKFVFLLVAVQFILHFFLRLATSINNMEKYYKYI